MSDRVKVGDKWFEQMILADQIAGRIREVAAEINERLTGEDPLCLIALKGGFLFAADLLRQLNLDPEVEFIGLRSYAGMQSTGTVDIVHALDRARVQGRDVLILEDIVDTGLTLKTMCEYLEELGARSVMSVVLLLKPESVMTDVRPDIVGFEIPDVFVVGYGLDYDQRGRSLSSIYKSVEP